MFKNNINYITNNKILVYIYRWHHIIITIFLFILPFTWLPAQQYNLGGDDGRLYLYDPYQTIINRVTYPFTTNAYSLIGVPQQVHFGFNLLVLIIKTIFPFLNTQLAIYGLMLSLSFLFVYLLIQELVLLAGIRKRHIIPPLLGGFSYMASPLLYHNLSNPVIPWILIATMPSLLFFFIKTINTKQIRYLFYGVIISVLFSSYFTTPNFLASILVILIFIVAIILIIDINKLCILKYLAIFIIMFIGVHMFWILPLFNHVPDLDERIASVKTSSSNISALASSSSIYYSFIGIPNMDFTLNRFLQISHYIHYLYSLFILLPIIVFLSLLITAKYCINLKKLILVISIIVLITLYLQTVNIGEIGIELYNWLLINIPLFNVLRSFWSKFYQIHVLFYSILLGLSIYMLILNNRKIVLSMIMIIILGLIISLQAIPLLKGDVLYTKFPNNLTRNVVIPQYYNDLINYIENKTEAERVIGLPLTKGSWVFFKGENEDDIYIGKSVLRSLKGIEEIGGRINILNFPNKNMANYVVQQLINAEDFNTLYNFMRILGVKYIVYNPQAFEYLTPDIGSVNKVWGYETFQTKEKLEKFITSIGKEVKRFGPIQLYEITSAYPIIYATNELTYFVSTDVDRDILNVVSYSTKPLAFYTDNDPLNNTRLNETTMIVLSYVQNDLNMYNVTLPVSGIYTLYEQIENKFVQYDRLYLNQGNNIITINRPMLSIDFNNFTNWIDVRYGWKIFNGSVSDIPKSNWPLAVYNKTFNSDIHIRAKGLFGDHGYNFIIFGYKDDKNFYYCGNGIGKTRIISLVKIENGFRTVLGTSVSNVKSNEPYHLDIIVDGSRITCFENGIKMIEKKLDGDITGKIGIYGIKTTSYDYIKIFEGVSQRYFLVNNIHNILPSINITFSKKSPVEYVVNINNSSKDFTLVFSEPYSDNWVIYDGKLDNLFDILYKKPSTYSHFQVNGYANAWFITNSKNFITIFYWPQIYFYLGSIISVFSIIVLFTLTHKNNISFFLNKLRIKIASLVNR